MVDQDVQLSRVGGAGARGDPAAGRVIENPISGERIVIRESGAQNGGRLLVFDLYLPPGAHVPARHVHPAQEEQFTVVAGRMRFRLGRRTILARPGDTVLLAGKGHEQCIFVGDEKLPWDDRGVARELLSGHTRPDPATPGAISR